MLNHSYMYMVQVSCTHTHTHTQASYPGHMVRRKSGLVSTAHACVNDSGNFPRTSQIMESYQRLSERVPIDRKRTKATSGMVGVLQVCLSSPRLISFHLKKMGMCPISSKIQKHFLAISSYFDCPVESQRYQRLGLLILRPFNFKRRPEYTRNAFLGGVYSIGSNRICYDHLRSLFTRTSGYKYMLNQRIADRQTYWRCHYPGRAVTDTTDQLVNKHSHPPTQLKELRRLWRRGWRREQRKRQPQFHVFTTMVCKTLPSMTTVAPLLPTFFSMGSSIYRKRGEKLPPSHALLMT